MGSWHDELMSFGPDGEHRAGRLPNHLLGNAAHQHLHECRPAMGAQDDQVDSFVTRIFDDLQERPAFFERADNRFTRRPFLRDRSLQALARQRPDSLQWQFAECSRQRKE